MTLAVAFSAIKFLFKRYSDAKDKKLLSLHLLGTLNRELAFNSELSGEAEKIPIKYLYCKTTNRQHENRCFRCNFCPWNNIFKVV